MYLYAAITVARSVVISEMNRDDSEIDIVGLEQAVHDIRYSGLSTRFKKRIQGVR